ncbi:MAG: TonB-dependent receptor [Cyclobacteriaceae bacterium]|nr:TonB-dependent receptor [Cyclobacteriaceae bacterium]
MNKTLHLFLLLIACTGSLLAQTTISIVDKNTSEPVQDAAIMVESASKKSIYISDANGVAVIDIAPPFTVLVSHVNYHSHSENIVNAAPLKIDLLPKNIVLEDIVVTGQYQPQSANNSVYTVKTVSEDQIKGMGATQLTDVLAKQLNIRISPDVAIGSSSMTIQGIQGKNLKILIDGVPLVNRNGNGNDADLSQINMANVERIEIVEGPMAVNYGANALAGVINLITKKVDKGSYRVGLDLQGESVDGDYSLNDGISNLNLTSGFSLTNNFLLSLNGGTYRFGGYKTNYDFRPYLWNPKIQYFFDGKLTYSKEGLSISYKLDNLNEKINNLDTLRYESQSQTGSNRPYGDDIEYNSSRISHQLEVNSALSKLGHFVFMASYSDFERKKRTYRNYLDSDQEDIKTADGLSDTTGYKTFVSRASIQTTKSDQKLNYQIGYEVNFESTFGGRIKDNQSQYMNDYALFATAEITPFEGLKLRPGLRGSVNSTFGSNVSPALNIKYKVNSLLSFNAAYGRGYRAPGLRELYFEFVDSNHNVFGNEDLKPEFSNHFDLGATHKWSHRRIGLKSEILFFYNDITDLIDYLYKEDDPTYAKFFNLASLKTLGINMNETFMWGHLTLGVGLGITGRNENDANFVSPDRFLFSPDISLDLSYLERISQIGINVFYKYNGTYSTYEFDNTTKEVYIGRTDPYSLLDFTLNRKITKYFNTTLGVKNVFNISNVNSNAAGGGAHTSDSGKANIGYGRSYFLRLSFNINSNK